MFYTEVCMQILHIEVRLNVCIGRYCWYEHDGYT